MTAPPRSRAQDQSVPDARLDDAVLIERSWHEPEAFATLYDRHATPIHRFAGRRLGDQMADDVVAETFLLLDPQTYRVIGINERTFGTKSKGKAKAAPITFTGTTSMAWVDVAIVDAPGQR